MRMMASPSNDLRASPCVLLKRSILGALKSFAILIAGCENEEIKSTQPEREYENGTDEGHHSRYNVFLSIH
jgi:hypothetical protein